MKFFDGDRCVENLTHEARVVLGLLWMGEGADVIVRVLGDGESVKRRYQFVSWVRTSKQPVIRQCREMMPNCLIADIKGSIRCRQCGSLVNVVPCRACMAMGKPTKDVEDMGEWAAQPTGEQPGTAGKVRVLAQRAARGEPLWHPQDRQLTGMSHESERRGPAGPFVPGDRSLVPGA